MTILQSTAVVAGVMPDHTRAGGVLNRYGIYTATTELTSPQTIEMVPIPAGARIIGMGLALASARSDAHLSVGDGSDTNRFFDSIDCAADADASLFQDGTSNAHGYQYSSEDTIDVYTGNSNIANGTKIRLCVQYVMTGTIADEA